ncbi:hypothetical protein [Dictyobacter alpinus]|uniref:hypothetical protein n=1 Tax=Dictyobacter alpinus TaxID=2014873 RepID=UPI000F81ACAD|nr:hypothetical protein [Dictyobacter alpinus]
MSATTNAHSIAGMDVQRVFDHCGLTVIPGVVRLASGFEALCVHIELSLPRWGSERGPSDIGLVLTTTQRAGLQYPLARGKRRGVAHLTSAAWSS